jgi:hypothetical protein
MFPSSLPLILSFFITSLIFSSESASISSIGGSFGHSSIDISAPSSE